MELVRIVRKSLLCIVCLFIAMICISLYQINYNQDSKVYKYYKEIIADYNNIKNDNVAFTAEKLTKTYEQYKEEDSEYIEEAAGLIKEKEKYIESYNADNQSKNYNRILQSTLFGNDTSFNIRFMLKCGQMLRFRAFFIDIFVNVGKRGIQLEVYSLYLVVIS